MTGRDVMGPVALWGLALACTEPGPPAEFRADLRELRRYGTDTLAAAAVDPRTREVAGAILADVAGLVTDPAGTLYVLDRDWRKIVVFGPDGEFQGLVPGGAGDGPGEFRLPVHLTWAGDGALSVLDYELSRVTWFGEGGELSRMVRLDGAGMLRHAVLGDTIFITGHGNATSPIARLFSSDGERMGGGPLLAPEDRPFGTPVGLATTTDGRLLVTTPRPGVWMELRQGRWSRVGGPLFPDVAPPVEEVTGPLQTRVTPALVEAGSVAAVGDSLVLQGFRRYTRPFSWDDPPTRDEVEWALAVFTSAGDHLATVVLPPGSHHACTYVDPRTSHVFLCATEPFPQVVEYALELGTLEGG